MLYLINLHYYNQIYLSFALFGSVVLPADLIGRALRKPDLYSGQRAPWYLQSVRTHLEDVCKRREGAAVYSVVEPGMKRM